MPSKAKEQCWPKTYTLMKHRIPTYNTFHIPIRLRPPSQFWIFSFVVWESQWTADRAVDRLKEGKAGDAERRFLLETTLLVSTDETFAKSPRNPLNSHQDI